MELLVKGQGVVIFKNSSPTINICFYDKTKRNVLHFVITNRIKVYCNNVKCYDPSNKSGVLQLPGAYYWISVDAQNQKIFAGVGEPRLETATYNYSFVINKENKRFLESLTFVECDEASIIMKRLKDSITQRIPLTVKNTDDLTMIDIAKGNYLPKANLSIISQKLYDCISGKNFSLNDEFFDFVGAIENSIATPGLWCNAMLKRKVNEFSEGDPKETYLRITLGQNNGESPGVPYVMEIWPVGHYSPIHSHANTNAIIRVLNGKIHVKLYPFLCGKRDGVAPFGSADFKKGDITWISPTLNQTHQLYNLPSNTETCITIQCYMYDEDNRKHYDYFDYLDTNGHIHQYEPDSDLDFITFREIMKMEWEKRK